MIVGRQYKILSELGAGGMGLVYQGVDQMLEREVAIKKLRSEFSRSPEVAERFQREAKIQARLNHPNLAHLYSFFKEDDVFYIVMEFVDGTPLSKLLPLSWQEAMPVIVQVLDGLEYAHSMDVLHRDVKPDNIMVNPRGEVKVMDFGIAHVLGSVRQTREKTIVGTLEYVPPEQIGGKAIGPVGDVYSLGIMLFELISGRTPFVQENEFALLRDHLETPTPALSSVVPGVPAFMDEAIGRATAKNPQDRFPSCRSMADFLRKSVPDRMDRQEAAFLRRSRQGEVDRCVQRLDALLAGDELGLAALIHERALADYPGQTKLTEVGARIRRQRDTVAGAAKEDAKSQFLRETLTRLKEFEAQGQMVEAGIYVKKALERYPQVPALKIAAAQLGRKT